MKFKDNLKIALIGLRTNTTRSILTTLGIVIGIASIIIVMSVGEGASNLILDQVRGLGSRTIIIQPGREPQGPSDFEYLLADSLKEREIEALKNKNNVRGIEEIAPSVNVPGRASYLNETATSSVVGSSPLIARILGIYPDQGSLFGEEEINQKASVAVIGYEVKNKLFGPSDALGEKIKIGDRLFRVIGVFPPTGQVALLNVDDLVMIPYTTAQTYMLGIDHYHSIFVQAESEEIVPLVVKEIELTLRELHDISDPDKDDFHVTTQADIAARVGTITGILTALLVSVAAISLIVGGIGIMNIMLVSVTERTREIGLRKAIGAESKTVLNQFLLEAVILTVIGGAIGIFLGALFSLGVAIVMSKFIAEGWKFAFPISAAIIGFSVSAIIGLAFGIYPAKQAAKKSPIEALRYE